MRKLKNGIAAVKNEVREEMIKGGRSKVVDWIWRLFSMGLKGEVLSENWRSAVTVPQCKDKKRGLNVRIVYVLTC